MSKQAFTKAAAKTPAWSADVLGPGPGGASFISPISVAEQAYGSLKAQQTRQAMQPGKQGPP